MSVIDITKLVDKRNESLWNEINSSHNVQFEDSLNSEYRVYSQSKNITFYIPVTDLCPDSFTHELLHVYIRLKGVFIGSNLTLRISSSNILNRIFDRVLLEHIGNCLDHIKMLPIYLQMGFKKEKFLFDFYTNKCIDAEINELKSNYKTGSLYNISAVKQFIGKFIAVYTDPNENFSYYNCLAKLKKIDEKLFHVLEDFINSWGEYDIENCDPSNCYQELVDKFYDGLKMWITKKVFV